MTLEKEFQLVLTWFVEGRVFHKQSDRRNDLGKGASVGADVVC